MKPVKLVMNAFGPYKNRAEIDFLKLENKSLFLITGSTGAGKSTIFDAITFALYGRSNLEGKGYEKDSRSFKSDFSGPETECFVEYTFEVRGKEYFVRRAPLQEVNKLRGEGTREKPEEVLLKYRDSNGNTVIKEKITEVREDIERIVGLTVEQFRQIMIIPQGQFRKVISSDTKERKEILQKLFDISICTKIQDALKESAKEKELEIKESEKEISKYLEMLLKETEKECKETDILEKTEFYISEKEKNSMELGEIEDRIKESDRHIDRLNSEKGKADILNSLIESRDNIKRKIENLESQEEEYRKKEKKLKLGEKSQKVKQKEERYREEKEDFEKEDNKVKELEREIEIKGREAAELKRAIEESSEDRKKRDMLVNSINKIESMEENAYKLDEKLQRLSELRTDYLNKSSFLIKEEREFRRLLEEIKDPENLDREEKKLYDKILDYKDSILKYENQIKIIEKTENDFITISKYIKSRGENKDELKKLKKAAEELEIQEKNLKEEIRKLRNEYEKYMVSKLRKRLKEGSPCPVCGSTEHKCNEYADIETDVTEEKIEELEKDLEKCSETLGKKKVSIAELETKANEAEEKAMSLLKRIKTDCRDIGMNVDDIRTVKEAREKFLAYGCKVFDDERMAKRRKDNAEKEHENLKKNISENKDRIKIKENKEKNISEIERAQIELKTEILTQQNTVISEKNRIFSDEEFSLEFDNRWIAESSERELSTEEISAYEIDSGIFAKNYRLILERKKQEEKELTSKFEKQDIEYDSLSKYISEKKGEFKSSSERRDNLKARISGLKEIFYNALTENGFGSEADYRECYMEEKDIKNLKDDIVSYKNDLENERKAFIDREKEIDGREKADISKITEEIEERKAEQTKLYDMKNRLESENKRISELTESIKKVYKKNEEAIEEYGKIKDLSSVANRNNRKNISFEAYVLSTYLDEILEFTIQRFTKMTDGRFEIYRKEDVGNRSAESGLDLEVYDNYSSKRRDIKTLSGGESFKAALSMALGLSDVVKMYSGGIGIDTIFIDEGFGTLSPESLDAAIDTLVEIQDQGRLVGIISHVEDLKERIPDKIEIVSGPEGSTLKAFENN